MNRQSIKKLYETKTTNLPTDQPARYYGRADGNVYVLYSKSYTTKKTGQKKLEYQIARVNNCSVNGAWEVSKDGKKLQRNISGQYPQLDSPDIKKHIKIIDTSRQIQGAYELAEKWFFNNKNLPMISTR